MSSMKPGLYPVILYNKLRNDSSAEKHLTIKDLVDDMKKYNQEIEEDSVRKNVERHIDSLLDYDENIVIETKTGNPYIPYETRKSDIASLYYDGAFTSADLQLLSDALIYSKHLKRTIRDDLLRRLHRLVPTPSPSWYLSAIQTADELSFHVESELYRNLDYIHEAISRRKCIDYTACRFNHKRELVPNGHAIGFTPYAIYLDENIYYVVGVEKVEIRRTMEQQAKFHKQLPFHVVRHPLYRMKHIRLNEEAYYCPRKLTDYDGKTLKDLANSDYVLGGVMSRKKADMTADFQVDLHGLTVLIESFGKRVRAIPNGCNSESALNNSYYNVHLSGLRQTDYDKIILLLIQNNIEHLRFLGPKDLLSSRLNRLSVQLSEQAPSHPFTPNHSS